MLSRKENMQTPEDFLEANGFVSQQLDRSALVATFLKEMEAGLKGEPSSLAMIPTYVSPSGDLKRDTPVAVLDAGGTNLRAGTVSFPTGATEAKIEHLEKGSMPGTSAYVAPDDFYGTFAAHLERTKPFAADSAVGFCFSYACEAAPDGDAKLLHWTKQIQAPEIVGQWIGAELKKRLSFTPSKLLVLNDTVTTLLAGKATEKPGQRFSAYIGFILGTGTNVAYVQKTADIPKLAPGDYPTEMIVNSESGGFAKIAQSKFDAAMDAKSRDKGSQVFEKMIAGAYLGAIGLEIFKAAAKVWDFIDCFIYTIAEGLITCSHGKTAEVAGNGTCIMIDGHLVIIQDNNKIFRKLARMRKTFKCHTASKGTVAYDSNYLAFFAVELAGCKKAQSRRN